METSSALHRMGLNEKEQRLYLAALELGRSSITELAHKAHIKRPTAYNIANDLQARGLLSVTTVDKRKVYSPTHPKRLLEIARSTEKDMEELLPNLLALYNTLKKKPKIQVFEGIEGVEIIYKEVYHSLSRREEALWFTHIGALKKSMPESLEYYKQMLKKINNPRIRELNYGDKAGVQWIKETKQFQGKNFQIRVLSPHIKYGFTDNLIFGNKLVIFSFTPDVFVIVIESEDIATTFRALFEHAWTQGQSVK